MTPQPERCVVPAVFVCKKSAKKKRSCNFKEKKNFWITAVPATFMSAVSSTYFVLAPECLGGLLNSKTAEGATIYNTAVAYPIGVLFAVAMLAIFIHATKKSAAKA